MAGCRRRIAVQTELERLGLHCNKIILGEIDIQERMTLGQLINLKRALIKAGFELMDDHKAILVERIKITIVEMVRNNDEIPKTRYSTFLSEKLNHDYTYLANLYSELTGNTIEQFYIKQKIEKAKELILFNELNLTQISYKLNYSSVAHLSSQFKKITGLTPSLFKQLKTAALST